MKPGTELIAEERQEQITRHGYTAGHDDHHTSGMLIKVAAILAVNGTDAFVNDNADEACTGDNTWGLEGKLAGDENKIHRLKIAGALIAAEIDRVQRANKSKPKLNKS